MYIEKRMKNNNFEHRFQITKPGNVIIKCYYKTKTGELEPCTVILADYQSHSVKIQNYTNDNLHRAFGIIEEPTWQQYEEFLESRCFPKTRANRKDLLRLLGLGSVGYEPLEIIKKTNGEMAEDRLTLKVEQYDPLDR